MFVQPRSLAEMKVMPGDNHQMPIQKGIQIFPKFKSQGHEMGTGWVEFESMP